MTGFWTSIQIEWFINGLVVGSYGALSIVYLVLRHRKKQEEEKILRVANEVLQEVFPSGCPLPPAPPPVKRAVLTKEMQERGPVPDVPAIRWNDHAIANFIKENGMRSDVPIMVTKNMQTGDIVFEQAAAK